MKSTVPIIIPYFKAPEKLKKCVDAIENQAYRPFEVFVRDNSEDNILFTAAVNEGLKKFCFQDGIDYVLILNQDAYLQNNTLDHLVALMETHPDCGIACPIQVDSRGGVSWGGSYEAFPFGRHRCDPLDSYTTDFETYWANGAAMLLRTALVREIGLWDKNMRFIGSDADYSFTARSRGWSVMVSAKAHVYHSLDSSAAAVNDWINNIKLRDLVYFSRKWLTGSLYKGMSFEGESLTRLKIKMEVENFQRHIDLFKQ